MIHNWVTGPVVLHQWPAGSIIPGPSVSTPSPLFDFSSVSEFIIPRQDLCQQSLSVCINGYRILGHPMCLQDPDKYARNEYIFNFCMVIEERVEFSAYEKAVKIIVKTLTDAEEQEDFMLEDEERSERETQHAEDLDEELRHVPKMRMLCENVLWDLNRYGECIIPLSEFKPYCWKGEHELTNCSLADAHEINMKLFPSVLQAPSVSPWQVPMNVVDLNEVISDLWDMTVQRVAHHIDGVNHVGRIAQLADVDVSLAQQAVRQLLRFGVVVLLDLFHYQATYAPTPELRRLLFDADLQAECAQYASIDETPVSNELIVSLYTSLSYGTTLKAWVLHHQTQVEHVDVRRFITVGLLKGIVYRVHHYAIKDAPSDITTSSNRSDPTLDRFLISAHTFDEICTTLSITPTDLTTRLASHPDIRIIER